MDALDIIGRLTHLARKEPSPRVDVTGDVMQRIRRSRSRPRILSRDLGWVAAVSAIAAGVLLFLTAQAWSELSDPVVSFFQPLFLVIR